MYAVIASQNQLTLPPAICATLHIQEGSRVDLVIETDSTVRLIPVTNSVTTLKGMLPPAAKIMTLEEMDAAIALRMADI